MNPFKIRHTIVLPTLLLALIVALAMGGCASKEEKVAKFISKGDKLMEAGDATKALLEYKNAAQIDPKNARARFAMGKAFLSQQEWQKAFQAFRAAIELDEKYDEARLELASILATARMGEEAMENLTKMVSPDSFQPRVSIVKARAMVSLKKYFEAIDVLKAVQGAQDNGEVQALLSICYKELKDFKSMTMAAERWRELDPKSPAPYLLLAQHAAIQGDKQRAQDELEALIKANPEDSQKALLRAQVLTQLGFHDEAERAYEALPAEPMLVKARADYYLSRGRDVKARQTLEDLLAKEPKDADAVLRLARIHIAKGEPDKALEWFDKTLKLELEKADRERLVLSKASVLADQKKIDEAKVLIEEVLKDNQGNLDAHMLMGRLLLDAGKSEEAEIHLNQVAVARPDNPQAHLLLAQSQLNNKKDAMALETLKTGLKALPESTEVRIGLVRALVAGKDAPQALRVLDEGLVLKSDDLVLLKARGELLTAAKEFVRAEEDFKKILLLQPKHPAGYLEMGRLMLAQNKIDEAIKWYRQAMDQENGWQSALPILLSVYLSKEDNKSAIALAEEQAGKHPDAALAHHLLGQTHLRAGNSAKAQAAFVKATDLAPDWIEPYRALIEAYKKEDKADKALGKLEELHRKRPSAAAALVLAQLLEEKQRFDEATKLYQELIDKSNQSPSVMNDIAFLFAERRTSPKDLALAAELAARALATAPENPAYLDTVAWIAFKQGKLDEAWQHLQRAMQKDLDAGTLNYHAAVVAHARGDKQAARDFLEKALLQQMDPLSQEAAMKLKKEWES